MSMPKICHLTTAHARYDTRIFLKECCSLAERYETHLIVSDGKGNEVKNNVHIHDTGVKTSNRLVRFIRIVQLTYREARVLNCDLYHFHDPDFIPAAVLLKIIGKKVIYDTHEDVPRQMVTKDYLGIFKKPIAFCFELLENWAARRFTAVITATPFIRKRFIKINPRAYNINNYPLLHELSAGEHSFMNSNTIVYVGGVTKAKGVPKLIDALDYIPVTLELAGPFETEGLREELMNKPGWKKVNYHGNLDRRKTLELLKGSRAGIVTFNPVPNYVNALPIKMFEYMSAGLPVVCSAFASWKEIVEDNHCGVSADPMDPKDIADKIMLILNDPASAAIMGKNGIQAVKEKFNWEKEKEKLFIVYADVLNDFK